VVGCSVSVRFAKDQGQLAAGASAVAAEGRPHLLPGTFEIESSPAPLRHPEDLAAADVAADVAAEGAREE
jgi:hypothetical protein